MVRPDSSHPTLVLIHAFPFGSSMWEPQREALADRVPFCTPDLPGFGGQPRLDGENFSMKLAARHIRQELDSRKIERCIIGGLSMGGYVAMECWKLFPERIAGMILADTRASADTEEARRGRFDAAERIGGGEYEEYVEELLGKLLAEKTRRERPDVVEMVRGLALRTIPESAIAALLGMAVRADSTDILPSITVPTALIFGEHDSITNVEEGRTMSRAIPDAKLTIISDAGHLANLESPEAFNDAVMELLERVTAVHA